MQAASAIKEASSSAECAFSARVEGWESSVRIAEGEQYYVCDGSCAGSPNAIAGAHAFENDGKQP
jgi:hypothetical protein